MATKNLKIGSLLLDQNNPRIPAVSNQREALQQITAELSATEPIAAVELDSKKGSLVHTYNVAFLCAALPDGCAVPHLLKSPFGIYSTVCGALSG